jgi:hypothetical protein
MCCRLEKTAGTSTSLELASPTNSLRARVLKGGAVIDRESPEVLHGPHLQAERVLILESPQLRPAGGRHRPRTAQGRDLEERHARRVGDHVPGERAALKKVPFRARTAAQRPPPDALTANATCVETQDPGGDCRDDPASCRNRIARAPRRAAASASSPLTAARSRRLRNRSRTAH